MAKVLITGATGNVGIAVLKALQSIPHTLSVYAGVRDLAADKAALANYNVSTVLFDFMDATTYNAALTGCDVLFLLRPPQISNVEKYFKPIIKACVQQGVKHIVFLSVQGVEKSKIIPHHKIEKLIVENKIPYTFLRPAYFMQNFTTTLKADLATKHLIYLPAGNAQFTVIDVGDIGLVAADVITNSSTHLNKAYEITNTEKLTFADMAAALSAGLGVKITYTSPSLIAFFIAKKRQQMPTMLILVMIMLHYFPRFQKSPAITNCVAEITNKQPTSFSQFIADNKEGLRFSS